MMKSNEQKKYRRILLMIYSSFACIGTPKVRAPVSVNGSESIKKIFISENKYASLHKSMQISSVKNYLW